MDRWIPRWLRGPGSAARVVVLTTAVVLAASSLGFLLWALLTRNAARLAWLTSMAAVLAVVLPSWGMSAGMLAWVRRSRAAALDTSRRPASSQGSPRLRSLGEVDPFDLEVKRPLQAAGGQQVPTLPQYVRRDHDTALRRLAAAAATGESRLAVVVGDSSTGKTRACWEMLEPLRALTPPWQLWHPIEPTRPDALLAGLPLLGPRTVVWLNEAQSYLDTPDETGEKVAAALRELLRDPARGPVLMAATLWPKDWETLTTRAEPDRHAQARELLSGRKVDVPDRFSPAALTDLSRKAASDPLLAEAAAHAPDGKIIQYLAGVPILMDRYQQAPPAARALIHAAMDARRMGCGRSLPLALLAGAAPAYMTEEEWDQLGDENWLDQALAYATQPPGNGISGPLTRIRARARLGHEQRTGPEGASDADLLYRLADYLDQYGRRDRQQMIPPPGFWAAAMHSEPTDIPALADSAHRRGLLRPAALLDKQATGRSIWAAGRLVSILHGCRPADQRPARWVAAHAAIDQPDGVATLISIIDRAGARRQLTTLLARDPAARSALDNPHAIADLLYTLQQAGAWEQAGILATRAARYVSLDRPYAIADLLDELQKQGAAEQAAVLAERAARDAPLEDPHAVAGLLNALRDMAAHELVAILFSRNPAAHAALNVPELVGELLDSLRKAGAHDQATVLANRAAQDSPLDHPYTAVGLLSALLALGDQRPVATLLSRDLAAHAALDSPRSISRLLRALREAGAQEQVFALAERAARHAAIDRADDAADLLKAMQQVSAQESFVLFALRAARDAPIGEPWALIALLDTLHETGAQDDGSRLLNRAIEAGPGMPGVVSWLVSWMWDKGSREQAIRVASRAVADMAIEDPVAVANMLRVLRRIGAEEQAAALLARDPAAFAALDRQADAKFLLSELNKAGADEQAGLLVSRLPAAGLFDLFCAQGNHRALYRFGREPDGSPAPPWDWDNLECATRRYGIEWR